MELIKSKNKIERIIGLFIRAKKMQPENDEQIKKIIQKNKLQAIELECYSDMKIINTMKYLIDKADFKWTLGTVAKYIDEDIDDLYGRIPIITLKDGEKVFEIKRLKELEKDGRIIYKKNKWCERYDEERARDP